MQLLHAPELQPFPPSQVATDQKVVAIHWRKSHTRLGYELTVANNVDVRYCRFVHCETTTDVAVVKRSILSRKLRHRSSDIVDTATVGTQLQDKVSIGVNCANCISLEICTDGFEPLSSCIRAQLSLALWSSGGSLQNQAASKRADVHQSH